MKKILFLLAFVPFLVNAQIPGNQTTLIDLSKYHDNDRIMEMVDENLKDMTTGLYTVPLVAATDITVADDLSVTDDLDVTGLATVGETLGVTGVLTATAGISNISQVVEKTALVTIDSTKIVGTSAGDIGHADGAILVAAPGTGYAHEFVSAFFIYDHATADFAGGGDDIVVQVGVTGTQVAVSGAITDANLLTASGDKMLRLGSTATELAHADNGVISLQGTALTNNGGTAAGVLRVHVTYRVHTTGL